jgi:arylsulfatase A-like enzyme
MIIPSSAALPQPVVLEFIAVGSLIQSAPMLFAPRLVLGTILLVSVLPGCNRSHIITVHSNGRFACVEKPVTLDRDALERPVIVDASLVHPRERAQWDTISGSPEVSGDGLAARGRRIRFGRDLSIVAATVSQIDITFAEPSKGPVRLHWTHDGDSVGPTTMELRPDQATTFKGSTYRFLVRSNPNWTGTVTRLEIASSQAGDGAWDLLRVLAVGPPVPEGDLFEPPSPFRIDLGHEVRTAMPATPTRPLRLSIPPTVPGDIIHLGFARDIESRGPIALRGTAILSTGERLDVLSADIRTNDGDVGPWNDFVVAAPPVDEPWTLLLETTFQDSGPSEPAFGWWSEPAIVGPTSSNRPNILLVVLDTLRADRTTVNDPDLPTTPFLAEWSASHATVFETAIAPSPWTIPSHTSLFTGRYTIGHGVNHPFHNSPGLAAWEEPSHLPLMAEILRNAGYRTLATTGGAYLHPRWGLDVGFDRYAYFPSRSLADREMELGVDRILRWMKADPSGPWLIFLHTYEVHDPYVARPETWSQVSDLPMPERTRFVVDAEAPDPEDRYRLRQQWMVNRGPDRSVATADDSGILMRIYDSRVAWADRQLERLLTSAPLATTDRPTLVIITSDHGQGLGTAGEAGHVDLTHATLRIPLVISWPDHHQQGMRVPHQAGLVDVLPTMLEAAGVTSPDQIDGRSLRNAAATSETALSRTLVGSADSTNAGVFIRFDEGPCLVYDDTALLGSRPRVVWSEAGCADGPSQTVEALAPKARTSLDQLLDVVRTDAPGVVITVHNTTPEPLAMALEGLSIRAKAMKTMKAGGPVFDLDHAGSRATCTIPPLDEGSFRLQKVFHRSLKVAIDGPGDAALSTTVDLVELRDGSPATWVLDNDSRWRRRDRITDATTSIQFQWLGPRRPSMLSSDLDPQVRDHLEALGYVH